MLFEKKTDFSTIQGIDCQRYTFLAKHLLKSLWVVDLQDRRMLKKGIKRNTPISRGISFLEMNSIYQ